MSRKATASLVLIVMVSASTAVRGQTIYNDGGTHTVSGPSGPIILEGAGTTLDIVSPASVTGDSNNAGILGESGTTVNLMGGAGDRGDGPE